MALSLSCTVPISRPSIGESADAFFEALLEDIAAARGTIHFETFLWKEGALGRRMAEAFSKQARMGVKVRLVKPQTYMNLSGQALKPYLRLTPQPNK